MTKTDTIGRVARGRGVLSDSQREQWDDAALLYETIQTARRLLALRFLSEGASFNEVSKYTGLSKDTLQRWKREAGK